MEQFTNWLISVYQSYGFRAFLVIILTIVITNLTKHPIVKKAEKYALDYNADKSVITKWIALLPYAYAFILNAIFVVVLAAINKQWDVDWGKYIGDSALFASLSVAGFEIGKKCLESYVSKKNDKEGK